MLFSLIWNDSSCMIACLNVAIFETCFLPYPDNSFCQVLNFWVLFKRFALVIQDELYIIVKLRIYTLSPCGKQKCLFSDLLVVLWWLVTYTTTSIIIQRFECPNIDPPYSLRSCGYNFGIYVSKIPLYVLS